MDKAWLAKGLGMRTIKTGLGIFLALWIAKLLDFADGSLAAITTIVAVQPSLKGSMKTIKNQLVATTFGCGIAGIVAYYGHGSYLWIGVGAILAVMLCVRFKLKETVSLVLITIIIIGQTPLENFEVVIVQRVVMLVIGLGIGFALNILVAPKHDHRLNDKIDEVRHKFEALYHDCIDDLIRNEHLSKDEVRKRIIELRDGVQMARTIYTLTVDSRLGYDEQVERDELYLSRKAINALSSNVERLVELHRSIVFAPNVEEDWYLKGLIHQYLKEIFDNHQKIYQYILYDEPIEETIIKAFDKQESELERTLLSVINGIDSLQPIHYCNIVGEAERIMLKTWGLVEEKHRVLGQEVCTRYNSNY